MESDWKPEDDGWMKVKTGRFMCVDCGYAFGPDGAWVLPCAFHAASLATPQQRASLWSRFLVFMGLARWER